MTRFRTLTLAVLLAVASLWPTAALAQTVINSTTLSAALPATGNQIALTSASTVAVGDLIFVDREAMAVNTITPTVTVTRGVQGTAARAHAALAVAYTGPVQRFGNPAVVAGSTCTAATEQFLPRIVLPEGDVYQCTGSTWWRIGDEVGTVTVTCRALLILDMVDQSCFVVDRSYVVIRITEAHKVAEAGGTLTIRAMRQQGTEAAASGDLLATAFNGLGVAETVVVGTLSTTPALLILSAGERLGLDFTDDAAGELAGVTVTFTLAPR